MPYRCPAGYDTIGYGHVIRVGEDFSGGIDQPAALRLLSLDVQAAEQAVSQMIYVHLTDGQYDALVSFTYNLGAGALQRSTLRRKINRGERDDAATEFGKWVYAGGRMLPGLIARRRAEQEVFIGAQKVTL